MKYADMITGALITGLLITLIYVLGFAAGQSKGCDDGVKFTRPQKAVHASEVKDSILVRWAKYNGAIDTEQEQEAVNFIIYNEYEQ